MARLFTQQGEDGTALPFLQSVAGSVSGSPFAVTSASAVDSGAISAEAILITSNNPVHIRISSTGVAATISNMLLPANALRVLPWRPGDHVSMIAPTGTSTVYIEHIRLANEGV